MKWEAPVWTGCLACIPNRHGGAHSSSPAWYTRPSNQGSKGPRQRERPGANFQATCGRAIFPSALPPSFPVHACPCVLLYVWKRSAQAWQEQLLKAPCRWKGKPRSVLTWRGLSTKWVDFIFGSLQQKMYVSWMIMMSSTFIMLSSQDSKTFYFVICPYWEGGKKGV